MFTCSIARSRPLQTLDVFRIRDNTITSTSAWEAMGLVVVVVVVVAVGGRGGVLFLVLVAVAVLASSQRSSSSRRHHRRGSMNCGSRSG